MISLALSTSNLRSSSDAGEPAAPGGEGKGANGTFSVVLASLGGTQAGAEGEITAAALLAAKNQEAAPETPKAALAAAANGITLPLPAETGKTLPDTAAGGSDGTEDVGQSGNEGDDVEVDGSAIVIAVPLLQLPASAEAKPANASAAQGSPPPTDSDGSSLLPAALQMPAKQQGEGKAEAPSVALHVAPQADTERSKRSDTKAGQELQPVKSREAIVEGLLPKTASADPAPQTPSASFAQGLQAESSHTARPLEAGKPALQADALQDLTRIVDRLTAAREASAPAAAALAVKHADFGDLSLRIDQQRDGHLAVQLSASDPDTHRAVAAAVSERSPAAMSDSHTGTGQSQAQARGAAAERGGNGGNTADGSGARQDRPQQGRSAPQDGQPGSGAQRSGIFA